MVKLFPIFKKVGTVIVEVPAAAVVNARVAVMAALRVTSRVVGTPAKPNLRAGVRVTQAPTYAAVREQPAVRVTTSASGTPRADKRAGFRFGTVLSAVSARVTTAVNVVRVFATGDPARPSQKAGVRVDRVTATGAPAFPSQKAGTNVQRVTASGTMSKPSQKTGARVVQTSVVLVHESGSPSVTQSGGTDWTSITNAQGKKDGTLAQLQGSATATKQGQLDFAYANFTDKTALTIRKVELRFYVRSSGTVLNNGQFNLGCNLTGLTTLESITGDVDNLTTPRTFDVTSAVSSWTDLDNLTTRVFARATIGNLITYQCDAVHVYVEADSVVAL